MKVITLVLLSISSMLLHAQSINFDMDPGLDIKEKVVNAKKMRKNITASLPLNLEKSVNGLVEFDFTIKRFSHYAPMSVGIKSPDGKNSIYLDFSMGDDKNRKASLYIRNKRRKKKIATWNKISTGKKYRISFKWTKDNKITCSAKLAGKEVFKGAGRIATPVAINDLFILAKSVKDNGYIAYDCEDKNIYMRSYIGGEGNYAYSIVAIIDNLSIKTSK